MHNTPLYDNLKNLSESNPLRFDMPGHHGKSLPYFAASDWTALDWTEHSSTGDLFAGGDCIAAAEAQWAMRWGADGCLFLTGGATEGVHIALHLCCCPGDTVLVDRGSHRSLWNGLALLDARPISVPRPWDTERELAGPLRPEDAALLWRRHPEAKALFVTSPTYYGICSDLSALASIAHQHGGKLIVDCAHGAHFPWIGLPTPCEQGADLTIASVHKELPVPGQAAVLLYQAISPAEVCRIGRIYGSSSPAYVMMAAMDRVRSWLDESGRYSHLIREILPSFQTRLEQETSFHRVLTDDPARLVLSTKASGCTGFEVQKRLEREGILIEMADLSHLVLISSCLDEATDYNRFLSALKRFSPVRNREVTTPPPPALPERVYTPRQAMFAESCLRSMETCIGQIAAEDITPYPPGVPVIAPGERIEKKHLEYLREIGYNGSITVMCPNGLSGRIKS